MFRIGLKKEEKEMLVRTISELQELRAELSLFKNTLSGMVGEGVAVQEADRGQQDGPAAGDGGQAGLEENSALEVEAVEAPGAEASLTEAATADLPVSEAGDQASGDGAGEGHCAEEPVAEAGGCPGEMEHSPEQDSPSPDQAPALPPAKRDWAVVNLAHIRRPWWRFWEIEKKVSRRSV